MGGLRPQGWFRDPFRVHEYRYFSDGSPTKLVRDGTAESYDEPPAGGAIRPSARGSARTRRATAAPRPNWPALYVRAIGAAGAVATAVVALASAVIERPVPLPRAAVIAAVAVMIAGLIWATAVNTRQQRRLRGGNLPLGEKVTQLYFSAWFLSPLPGRSQALVIGLALAG